MTKLAILTVKNEGPFLIDWFAHHRAVGFDRFLVFSNDCSDGTDAMLDRLQDIGWITHVRNDDRGADGPHWGALKAADRHPLLAGAEWVMVLDVDEYVNIHLGDRTLDALLAAVPQATAVALTWRTFGNAGVVGIEDAPLTAQFTRSAPALLYWPWNVQMFKTLFRNDGSYRKLGVHRPRAPDAARMAQQYWVDGSGRRLAAEFHRQRTWQLPGRDLGRLAQLNHYPLGAMESFLVKSDRGRANHEGGAIDIAYWIERNFVTVEDRSILGLDPAVAPLREALRADPVLGPLHQAALDWRRRRVVELLREPRWRVLLGQLMLAPPSRQLDAAAVRHLWQHPQQTDAPAAKSLPQG